jgi:uncharacterized repeat protein (TIGR01451 family)
VDLFVAKSHTGTAVVGGPVVFSLVVGNKGPTPEPGPVVVTDTLPAGLAFVSASGPGWTCTANGSVVTCTTPGPMAPGVTSTITLTVTTELGAFPSATNIATVRGEALDLDLANNTSRDLVGVAPVFDLSINKELESVAGTRATWLITVGNAGPHPAPGPFTVIDVLPDELAYVSSSGADWRCAERSGTVTCTFTGTLAAGASTELRIVTRLSAEPGQEVTNTASLGPEVGGGSDDAVVSVAEDGTPSGGGGGSQGGDLADSGAEAGPTLLAALLLLAGGAGLLAAKRRRSRWLG